jgi:hypothetical protein
MRPASAIPDADMMMHGSGFVFNAFEASTSVM